MEGDGCCGTSSCCGGESGGESLGQDSEGVSRLLGYSDYELAGVPSGANLGLGCGNPQAIASLLPGKTVLDLGSGAGFDSFLAAQAVGEHGHVIGVDMTPEMVGKARRKFAACAPRCVTHARRSARNMSTSIVRNAPRHAAHAPNNAARWE